VSQPTSESQEGAEAIRSFDIETSVAHVHGKQTQQGVTEFRVDAFGKKFELSQDQLKELDRLIVNGIQVSSESGYPGIGGKTIYIRLLLGFTSGVVASRYVVVSEET